MTVSETPAISAISVAVRWPNCAIWLSDSNRIKLVLKTQSTPS